MPHNQSAGMVVIMKKKASEEDIEAVITNLNAFGFDVHRSSGINQTVLGAIGVRPGFNHRIIRGLSGVADVQRVTEPYKLASRVGRETSSVVGVGNLEIGGSAITVMAGLRSIERETRVSEAATRIAASGASLFRGSTLKPRTSFYEFQGVEQEGFRMMRRAADESALKLVMEVSSMAQVEPVSEHADVLLVQAHNMQNFELLRGLGQSKKPILLERGLAATVQEWLMAAEHIMRSGNENVILCERGIRTFESATRYTLDLSAVSVAKIKSHLPIFVDPCQGTGMRDYVISLACAAVAAGADGIAIDVHHDPPSASSNGLQALNFDQFAELIVQVRKVADAVGRRLQP